MWSVGLLIGLIGGAGATVVAQRFFIKSKSQEIIKKSKSLHEVLHEGSGKVLVSLVYSTRVE